MMETIRRNDIHDGYIRLVVTRGKGDLGLNPSKCPKASVFCIAGGITLYPAEVLRTGLQNQDSCDASQRSSGHQPGCQESQLPQQRSWSAGTSRRRRNEGLFLTKDGYVCECTADNFFLIKGRKLMTPSTSLGALPGVTRAWP